MRQLLLLTFLWVAAISCRQEIAVPTDAVPLTTAANIYPDYREVTLPPNIAPLNFMVKDAGTAFVAHIQGGKTNITASSEEDGKLRFDSTEWRSLLAENKGKALKVQIYTEREGKWYAYPAYNIYVVQEDIDPYLSYRLIEPGYEYYRQVGLYQRNLTNFTEKPIYENNREFDTENNHCVNCHNFQNYDTKRMLFHVRAKHGGTIFAEDGKVKKMNMKNDSILSNCVYPSWHPTKNWVIFSTNLTGQAFHVSTKDKVEVVDYGSDLVFYDVDKGTLSNIVKTSSVMETFPAWAPDGKKIYFCAAAPKAFAESPDSLHQRIALGINDSIRYNIMSMTFDEATRTFGTPVLEVDCEKMGKSGTVPRISPDGKHLLFTLGGFGQFHIWHRDADQWIKNLETGEVYPLSAANSLEVDSYHAWSSNSRWIVFSSRREDGNYTRPAIAYIDKDGKAHKAFILPQEDPEYHQLLLRSYNVPELTRTSVTIDPEAFRRAIYNDEATEKAAYRP